MNTETSNLIDNGDGTVTDSKTNLMWTREDSWQMEARWLSWDEAKEFAHNLGYRKFAGYSDWRLPEKDELLTLLSASHNILDKYGKEMKMNPVFPAGPLATTWTSDSIGQDGYIVNFSTGEAVTLYKSKSGRMAVRPVRGTPFSERTSQ